MLGIVLCEEVVRPKTLFYGFSRVAVKLARAYNAHAMQATLRLTTVMVLLGAISACSMWKQPAKGWNGATSGEQLEKLWWADYKARNFVEMNKHVSETAMATTASGSFDKKAWFAHLQEVQLEDYALGEVEVQSNGADLMVSYVISLKGSFRGQPLPARERMLTVWQQVGKGYLIVAHSAVPLPETTPASGK